MVIIIYLFVHNYIDINNIVFVDVDDVCFVSQ